MFVFCLTMHMNYVIMKKKIVLLLFPGWFSKRLSTVIGVHHGAFRIKSIAFPFLMVRINNTSRVKWYVEFNIYKNTLHMGISYVVNTTDCYVLYNFTLVINFRFTRL